MAKIQRLLFPGKLVNWGMARVHSPYYLKERIDCLQFYEMGGNRYVRMVSSLTGKRVKKSPAFARTRESYGRLAKASPIASAVYQQLPKEMRVNGFYEKMVGMVILLLKDGYTLEQAGALVKEAARPELYEALREADLRKEGAAKGIGASIYYQLPTTIQVAGYEQALVEMAMQLLEEGMEVRKAWNTRKAK